DEARPPVDDHVGHPGIVRTDVHDPVLAEGDVEVAPVLVAASCSIPGRHPRRVPDQRGRAHARVACNRATPSSTQATPAMRASVTARTGKSNNPYWSMTSEAATVPKMVAAAKAAAPIFGA